MNTWSFYHVETGELHPQVFSTTDDSSLAINTPKDHKAIEGDHDHVLKCVDLKTKSVVDRDVPKPAPSADREYDPTRRRWVVKESVRALHVEYTALQEEQKKVVIGFLLGRGGAGRLREIDDRITAIQQQLNDPVVSGVSGDVSSGAAALATDGNMPGDPVT